MASYWSVPFRFLQLPFVTCMHATCSAHLILGLGHICVCVCIDRIYKLYRLFRLKSSNTAIEVFLLHPVAKYRQIFQAQNIFDSHNKQPCSSNSSLQNRVQNSSVPTKMFGKTRQTLLRGSDRLMMKLLPFPQELLTELCV